MGFMININFYRELSLLYKDNNKQRIERFKNLNNKICEIYNIKDKGVFDIKSIKDVKGNQTDIGAFDAFSKKMILESTYVENIKLSQIQLFEIMESLLHEPKHLKQLLEYEKDSSYPGFYTSLPTHLGYHSQKEEDEAYIQTYLEMQEIIDSHNNTTGNEKLFYDNMQKYVDNRIKEHTKFKEEDIKNFENLDIKLGNFFATKNKKQENLLDILKTIKEDFQPNAYVSASYGKLLSTCTGYEKLNFKENICEIFEHDKTWYGKIESKNQINKHSAVFAIKDGNLNISSFVGITNLKFECWNK